MKNKLSLIILMCLTLGLAPFFPEPHIVGKVKWILGGAKGMTSTDWFDFFFHATPFMLLVLWSGVKGISVLSKKE
jgi:hypothetical protein